jgi:phosphoglycerate dehydrogenase-like enzyme
MRVVLMYSLGAPSREHLERLAALGPELEIVPATSEADAKKAVAEAEVILGHRYLRQCLPFARRLRWVQSSAGSLDRLPLAELAKRGVVVTRNTTDSHVVAAHAVALAWALARALPAACRQQAAEHWHQELRFAPLPRRALVIGLGSVGKAIAARLRAQGIAVACAKRDRPEPVVESTCEQILTAGRWRDLLPEVDWCFLALTRTPETIRIFDESALRSLRSDAVLINVGRGETLDTTALLRVLEEGHLAGVGLDVVSPSPLPRGHPLWAVQRVLITPHIASHHPGRNERVERYFENQLARYLGGSPLFDIVDLKGALFRDTLTEARV